MVVFVINFYVCSNFPDMLSEWVGLFFATYCQVMTLANLVTWIRYEAYKIVADVGLCWLSCTMLRNCFVTVLRSWNVYKMSAGANLGDVVMNTFLPKWIFGTSVQQRSPDSNPLDAFRQRIYMQQVIWSWILWYTICFSITSYKAQKACQYTAKRRNIATNCSEICKWKSI